MEPHWDVQEVQIIPSLYTVEEAEELKGQSQAQTEASSEFACEAPIDKQSDGKLKYRRLKQKLNSIGYTHDDTCATSKEVTSPKKQRLFKLAIDFGNQIRAQTRDYIALEACSANILKIVDMKNEYDLHILKVSKIVPYFFELLQKIPLLHKNEFQKVIKTLEINFKILWIFGSIHAGREYLILTNRLNSLISTISWLLGRDERIAGSLTNSFYTLEMNCFRLTNSLLQEKCFEFEQKNSVQILSTTIQLLICSPIFRKIRNALFDQLYFEGTFMEPELTIEILKFILITLNESEVAQPMNFFEVEHFEATSNSSLIKLVEYILPVMVSYFILLCDSFDQNYPTFVESLFLITTKIINACFFISVSISRRIILELDTTMHPFLTRLFSMLKISKAEFDECLENNLMKLLLNELVVLTGFIGLENTIMRRKMTEVGILDEIFNMPIQFLMDSSLRDVVVPTLCCLIFQCKFALTLLLKDNSPLHIIKYLKKEIQSKTTLTRKGSTFSLTSMAANGREKNTLALEMRFPRNHWEALYTELERHV